MLIFSVLLDIEHVVLLQLYELIVSVLAALQRPCASTRVLLGRVEPVIVYPVAAGELNDLIKVYFGATSPFLLLFGDLGVASYSLVFHTICADSDSTLVLELHGYRFLLRLSDTLATVSVDYPSDR